MSTAGVPSHIHWAMSLGVWSPNTARRRLGLPPSSSSTSIGSGMNARTEIDWDRFRVGTVVGSRMDNRLYEVTAFDYSEHGYGNTIELELGIEPTGTATPDWWIPNYQTPGSSSAYIMFDAHAYMLREYEYDFPTMILKVGLARADWADPQNLSPFERALKTFRQGLPT